VNVAAFIYYGAFNIHPGDISGGDILGHLEYQGWHAEFLCKKGSVSYGSYKGGRFPFECKDVDFYILSTGLKFSHTGFGGRALPLPGFTSTLDASGIDDQGIGTEIGLLMVGGIHGISKKSTIFSAKVIDVNGLPSSVNVINAVTAILSNIASRDRASIVVYPHFQAPTFRVPVIEPKHTVLETQLKRLTDLRIPVFVPAGDGVYSEDDGNSISSLNSEVVCPSRMPEVFTVGAINRYENIVTNGCYGDLVDMYAPGENILTQDWISDKTISRTGSAYACALAAGCCSQFLHKFPDANSEDYRRFFVKYFKKNLIQDYPKNSIKQDRALFLDGDSTKILTYNYRDLEPFGYRDVITKPTYCVWSFFVRGYLNFVSSGNLGNIYQDVPIVQYLQATSVDGYGFNRRKVFTEKTPLPKGLKLSFRTGKIYGKLDSSVPPGIHFFSIEVSDGTYAEIKDFFYEVYESSAPLTALQGKVLITKKDWLTLDISRFDSSNNILDIKPFLPAKKAVYPERRKIVILDKATGSYIGETYSDKQTGEFFYQTNPGAYQLVMKSPDQENSLVVDQTVI